MNYMQQHVKDLIAHCKSLNTKRHCNAADATKFEPWMCDFVVELALNYGAIKVQFAAALGISWATFCKWRQKDSKYYIKEFDDAVKFAETISKSNFIQLAKDELKNPSEFFNATLYQMLGRYTAEFTEHRSVVINQLRNAKDYNERICAIINAAAEGTINSVEMQQFANAVAALAKVEEITELKNTVLELKNQVNQIQNGDSNVEQKS